jgi:hypothetical protein
MKNPVFSLAFAVTLSLLLSCKHQSELDVRESDFLNKSEITVQGVPVDVEMPLSIHGMIHCDSLNIVVTEDPRGYVFVYSSNWKLLNIFGKKGRTRNEFIESPDIHHYQIFKDADGHMLLPLSDRKAEKIKLMDITESLARQRTVIADVRHFEFEESTRVYEEETDSYVYYMSSFRFLYLDNNIRHTVEMTNSDFYERFKNPIQYRIRHDSVFVEKPEILTAMEQLVGPKRKSKFSSVTYIHPHRNLVIELFEHNDYIAFLDLDNDKRFFVHQKGSKTFDQEIDTQIYNQDGESFTIPAFITFTRAIPTDSFFIATYYGTSIDQTDIKPEAMFFDWDGNFIQSVRLGLLTQYNVYDPQTKTLYGIDKNSENEQLISFDLSPIINQ